MMSYLGYTTRCCVCMQVFKSYEPLAREMFQSIAIDANRNVQSP